MTTIRYFIPEDGDDEINPNVFLAAKSRHPNTPPTLGQIKDAFPLPGRYHFRFKSPLIPGGDRDKGSMAVWMDCVQDNVPVPTYRGIIVAKVTRVGVEDDDEDDDHDFVNGGNAQGSTVDHHSPPAPLPPTQSAPAATPAPAPQQPAQRQPQTNHEPFLDVFSSATTGASSTSSSSSQGLPPPAPTSTGNLLDGHHATAPSSGGLLDMGATYEAQHRNSHSDFFGMTAGPPAAPHGNQGGYNPAQYGQPQQQQQQQQQQRPLPNSGAFSNFSDQNGPFGGLGTPWK